MCRCGSVSSGVERGKVVAAEVAALADLGNFSTRPVGLREGLKVFPDRWDRVVSLSVPAGRRCTGPPRSPTAMWPTVTTASKSRPEARGWPHGSPTQSMDGAAENDHNFANAARPDRVAAWKPHGLNGWLANCGDSSTVAARLGSVCVCVCVEASETPRWLGPKWWQFRSHSPSGEARCVEAP